MRVEWIYPRLEPHGLIFKLNRESSAKLSDEVVEHDHAFWKQYLKPMIGSWLTEDTTIPQISSFALETYGLRRSFPGDYRYALSDYSQAMFSKSRLDIAELYEWRAGHATNSMDEKRMWREADFAFRQAWALAPWSP
jgi:hypothetical protein